MRNSTLVSLCNARDRLREQHRDISIQAAAQSANLSVYHFIRTFKAAFGQTPHQFLTQVRMERAQQLLMTDNASVTEICWQVGYTSLGSFCDRFTQHTGVPPSVYRQQMRTLVQVPGLIPRQVVPYCFLWMYGR